MKILCYGEILWDVFPDEKKIGGAPLNFAAHLVKNGVESAIFSSVGYDELGKEARDIINDLGIDTKYITNVDEETGVCLVTLNDGKPQYEIKEGTAVDNIQFLPVSETFNGLYIGSLAQRSETSRDTLEMIFDSSRFEEVFFDFNIRQNYYDDEILDFSLSEATIVKISREEIGVLKETGICDEDDYEEICKSLKESYSQIKNIVITLDKDGAFAYDCNEEKGYYSEKPKNKVVSTVGAGDSFSATYFASILSGKGIQESLEKANHVSDFVVTQVGAVPDYPVELIS